MSFYNDDYLRRLLIEQPYIRARLTNPGGSIIMTAVSADTDTVAQDYSSQIGSSFHLDLLEAEMKFRELPEDQQRALLDWAAGVSSKEAASYQNVKGNVIRKRVQRGVEALTDKMNENEQRGTDDTRTDRGLDPEGRRPQATQIDEEDGDD